jgi:hypothetical protein
MNSRITNPEDCWYQLAKRTEDLILLIPERAKTLKVYVNRPTFGHCIAQIGPRASVESAF